MGWGDGTLKEFDFSDLVLATDYTCLAQTATQGGSSLTNLEQKVRLQRGPPNCACEATVLAVKYWIAELIVKEKGLKLLGEFISTESELQTT